MYEERRVIEAYLDRDDEQAILVLVFEDGEHAAQNIDETSFSFWRDEGLRIAS